MTLMEAVVSARITMIVATVMVTDDRLVTVLQ
jgi:hypothetical protein